MATQTGSPALSRERLTAQSSFTSQDIEQINQCRVDHNRLGFAYNLAFVKLNNYFPQQQPSEIAEEVLAFTGAQLHLDPGEIERYLQNQDTIFRQQSRIRRYLGLRQMGGEEWPLLESFLFDECCQLEQTSALRAHAAQFLRDRRILQPAATTLDRIIGEQRRRARQHIFERLGHSLPAEVTGQLDALLEVNEETRKSDLQTIKEMPGSPSPAAIKRLIAKLKCIESTGVLEIDLAWLNNNYQRSLAKYARRSSAHRLRQEIDPSHRYAALVSFLWQTYQDTIDQLVDMQDKLVTRIFSQAHSQFDETLRQRRQSLRQSVSVLHILTGIMLDEGVADSEIRQTVFRRISKEEMSSQREQTGEWLSGANSHVFQQVVRRHEYIRKFFPALLDTLEFQPQNQDKSAVLDAVDVLKEANRQGKRTLPPDAPTDWLPNSLQPFVKNDG